MRPVASSTTVSYRTTQPQFGLHFCPHDFCRRGCLCWCCCRSCRGMLTPPPPALNVVAAAAEAAVDVPPVPFVACVTAEAPRGFDAAEAAAVRRNLIAAGPSGIRRIFEVRMTALQQTWPFLVPSQHVMSCMLRRVTLRTRVRSHVHVRTYMYVRALPGYLSNCCELIFS